MMAAIVVVLLGAAHAVPAAGLGPGTNLPALTLNDQHDAPGQIDATTWMVLFTRDMDASKVAKEALAENGEHLLDKAGVIYVADIARMPGFVTRFFAVPAMRKRPYRMFLDREGDATASFPTEEGHVTLIRLDGLTIRRVEHLDSAWALRRALRAAAAERATSAEQIPAPAPETPAAESEAPDAPSTVDQPDS